MWGGFPVSQSGHRKMRILRWVGDFPSFPSFKGIMALPGKGDIGGKKE